MKNKITWDVYATIIFYAISFLFLGVMAIAASMTFFIIINLLFKKHDKNNK